MNHTMLTYPLSQGFLHHWLVAGPVITSGSREESGDADPARAGGIAPSSPSNAGVANPIVDLGLLNPDNPDLSWRYFRCLADHWVDFTHYSPLPGVLNAWAFAILDCQMGGNRYLKISTEGAAAEVWLNEAPLLALEPSTTVSTLAELRPGQNQILVRLCADAARETVCRLAVQVDGLSDQEYAILLPTEIEPGLVDMRYRLETIAESACLDRYVYGFFDGDHYHKNEPIIVRYPSDLAAAGEMTHRLQSLSGDIFQESSRNCAPGSTFELARTFPLRNGPHHLNLLPPAKEFYEKKIQFERKDLFHVVRTDFSSVSKGNFAERAQQALADAAQRRNLSLYCEIAKMGLGQVEQLNPKALAHSLERIHTLQSGSEEDLLGYLGILSRYKKKFLSPEIREGLLTALKSYRYWIDQPGEDCLDYGAESRQIIFHTCEIIAGQLFPRHVFVRSRQTGDWHRRHGEGLALDWMRQRGMYGFREWDSPASVERVVATLIHLVDFAATESIRELAAILLDKVFFSLALNSWRGMYGASRGLADTPSLLSPRLEPTSGVCRLMWGLGNFNESLMATVSLALSTSYELPPIIEKIAQDSSGALWSRERSLQPDGGWEVNRVCYKTRDFMLASAQDYAPGASGRREHIWQATLGPDAIVYTNHPANMQVETSETPNLWAGNSRLPRVVQWGDVLAAYYHLPPDDQTPGQMSFTHAYFPASAFDEYDIRQNWAFARKAKAYLALYAAGGLQWIQTGKTALRELRSPGRENLWVCHMGQEMLDGDFTAFQQKILSMELTVSGNHLDLTSLRGDRLSLGWDGPLFVNGEEQSISNFKHYESPYCTADLPAAVMDILYEQDGLRLKFS